jgi:ribosomal protein L5
MGGFGLSEAYSLKDVVIDPLFVLHGMDVFMTEHRDEGAEDNMLEQPFLIR